mgnify:CR=1 FL=1
MPQSGLKKAILLYRTLCLLQRRRQDQRLRIAADAPPTKELTFTTKEKIKYSLIPLGYLFGVGVLPAFIRGTRVIAEMIEQVDNPAKPWCVTLHARQAWFEKIHGISTRKKRYKEWKGFRLPTLCFKNKGTAREISRIVNTTFRPETLSSIMLLTSLILMINQGVSFVGKNPDLMKLPKFRFLQTFLKKAKLPLQMIPFILPYAKFHLERRFKLRRFKKEFEKKREEADKLRKKFGVEFDPTEKIEEKIKIVEKERKRFEQMIEAGDSSALDMFYQTVGELRALRKIITLEDRLEELTKLIEAHL